MYRVLLLTLIFCASSLYAQEGEESGPKPAKLFSTTDTLTVTITAPWRDLVKNEKNQEPYPAQIEFTDDLNNQQNLPLSVSRRGLTRQRVCDFPPIKLYFQKPDVKGTTFRGQKNIKMVTHCKKSSKFQQYYILEMLAYRMYNLITDYSFQVRPLNITYVDSKTGKVDENRFAFLIEDDSDVAKRHDLKKLNVPKVKLSWLSPDVISDYSLFQYMIGNVDWATMSGPKPDECCHNSKLIGNEPLQEGDKVYPLPYDFDSAGIINAPYAAPNESLPIKRVTQRLYRGYCRYNDGLPAAREKSLALEADMYALLDNEPLLDDGTRKKAKKYLEKYYELIKSDKDFDKEITQQCRGKKSSG